MNKVIINGKTVEIIRCDIIQDINLEPFETFHFGKHEIITEVYPKLCNDILFLLKEGLSVILETTVSEIENIPDEIAQHPGFSLVTNLKYPNLDRFKNLSLEVYIESKLKFIMDLT